jgi:hypothetical protein
MIRVHSIYEMPLLQKANIENCIMRGFLILPPFSPIKTNYLRRLKWTKHAARIVDISEYEKYTDRSYRIYPPSHSFINLFKEVSKSFSAIQSNLVNID